VNPVSDLTNRPIASTIAAPSTPPGAAAFAGFPPGMIDAQMAERVVLNFVKLGESV
jgi:hypothetical protein